MENTGKPILTVEVSVNAPIEKVWEFWSKPEHITQWNAASEDWHTPRAENDLRTGGEFSSRMEAKDGSFGFDFAGTYDEVIEHELIAYTIGDRKVEVVFVPLGDKTLITESFEAESENSLEMQQGGWQSIMDNFKKYVEAQA